MTEKWGGHVPGTHVPRGQETCNWAMRDDMVENHKRPPMTLGVASDETLHPQDLLSHHPFLKPTVNQLVSSCDQSTGTDVHLTQVSDREDPVYFSVSCFSFPILKGK